MKNRNANRSLNSASMLTIAIEVAIFSVAIRHGTSTGTDTGNRRNERRRFFPSENITRAEMKDPTKERFTMPRVKTAMRGRMPSTGIFKFRKMMADGSIMDCTIKRIMIE